MDYRATRELARTQTLILAGGRGERLHPLTSWRPKPVVAFGDMFRIIDFTLSNCFHSGLSCVSLLTQYRHDDLDRYVRHGWNELWCKRVPSRKPISLLPPVAGKQYRGTADAVFQNRDLLAESNSDWVLVLSGDHVYHMDYSDLLRRHAETKADLTIATIEYPRREASHFGIVDVAGDFRVTGFAEKPMNPSPLPSRPSMALVSMGVYVFNKSVLLELLQKHCGEGFGYDFGHDIIPSSIDSVCTYAYDFRDDRQDGPAYWRDIGTLDGYYQASMDLVRQDAPFDPFANDSWPSQPTRHPSLKEYGDTVIAPQIGKNCDVSRSVVSSRVRIEDRAVVSDAVLLPGVRVGKGASLRRTIVEEGVNLPDGFEVGFDLDGDRKHHMVTPAGVVVVGKTPADSKSVVRFPVRNTRPVGKRQHDRQDSLMA